MREKQLNLWEFQQVTTRFAPSADDNLSITRYALVAIATVSHSPIDHRVGSLNLSPAWSWEACVSLSNEVEAFEGRSFTHVDFIYILSRYVFSGTEGSTLSELTLLCRVLTLIFIICEVVMTGM